MSTKNLNRFLTISIVATIGFAMFIVAVFTMPTLRNLSTSTTVITEVIEEDDPRWDCETMGNKVCGPTEEEATRFAERNCPIGFVAVAAPEYAESGAMECEVK
jgi:hypothetical protein